MPETQNIHVNGKPHAYVENLTVQGLLQQIMDAQSLVVVEVNGTIIPAEAFEKTMLCAGDRIEIVHFVGGG